MLVRIRWPAGGPIAERTLAGRLATAARVGDRVAVAVAMDQLAVLGTAGVAGGRLVVQVGGARQRHRQRRQHRERPHPQAAPASVIAARRAVAPAVAPMQAIAAVRREPPTLVGRHLYRSAPKTSPPA